MVVFSLPVTGLWRDATGEIQVPPYEYMQRAGERLKIVIPVTLAIIVLLLYLNFRRVAEVLVVLGTMPLALVGGIWLLYALDHDGERKPGHQLL